MISFTKIDKLFLAITALLVFAGFLIFNSASMGLLAKAGSNFEGVAIKQIVIGFIGGGLMALVLSQVQYTFYKKYAFYIFLLSIIATLLVFVPALQLSHGGATRWITLFGFSLQPAEILKFGFVVYVAAWLSKNQKTVKTFSGGFVPFFIISSIVAVILLLQPDTDTLAVILFSGLAMYFVAGAPIKHILLLVLIGIIGLGGLAFIRPYIKERMLTLLHPTRDILGSGYQVNQSLIAIGSGGVTGRGFGQSIQKFNYLPEPTSDSIFAVAAEEFGFVGSLILIILYLSFGLRGLNISSRSPDMFSRLLVLGIVIIIITQSFVNISAMLAIIPLSGIPLVFVSHGGTAMLIALSLVGVILNISTHLVKK